MRSLIKLSSAVVSTALTAGLLTACGADSDSNSQADNSAQSGQIKNIIMMIGDGMGPQQMGLLEEYVNRAPSNPYNGKASALSTFTQEGVMGLSMNGPHGSLVVDSACSASQLATGVASGSEMIGLDTNGDKVETILEKAKALGKATGLVSDTRMTHATPAAFAAHQAHRSLENEIAEEMLKDTGVDVMLSGGLRYWIPQGSSAESTDLVELIDEPSVRIKSKRKDDKNLLLDAQGLGYDLAFNRSQLDAAEGDKLLGLFAYSGMNNGIVYSAEKDSADRVQPSLAEMTKKALDVLSRDEDGFFLMIEGGQIDWAAHSNDAGQMLHELLKFDESVQAVYDWVKDRQDTLVIITADHETGSFGFSYSRTNLPEAQALSGEMFTDRNYQPNFNFGPLETLDKLHQQKQSFYDFYAEHMYDAEGTVTAGELMTEFNKISEFKITEAQAAELLVHVPNSSKAEADEKYPAGHKYLSAEELPKITDFSEFYVYVEEDHAPQMARQVAAGQNTVWGTGTHTSTPVAVIAWGPENVIKNYGSMMHHVNVGEKTIKAMLNEL